MGLSHDLNDWMDRLSILLAEGQELSRRIEELESQNSILQERLLKSGVKSEGLENLKSLYKEGFHICHAHFAEPRDEECLFCLSFFNREGVDLSGDI